MHKQTIMWTALPNGLTASRAGLKKLRLSAFMSPRLQGDDSPLRLGSFPDFTSADPTRNWASTVNAMTFKVQFRTKSLTIITVPATAVTRTSVAEPALWAELFGPDTPVKTYVAKDLSKATVNSFGLKDSAAALRDHIAAIASRPDQVWRLPRPEDLLSPPGFETSPLTAHLTLQMQAAGISAGAERSLYAAAAAPSTIHSKFMAFHTPFVSDWNRLTDAQRAARYAKERETDFHKAIGALGNYPGLLPRLGIVVNFEIALSSTLAMQLSAANLVRVIQEGTAPTDGVKRVKASPWTACQVGGKGALGEFAVTSFRARSESKQIKDGYLQVRDATAEGSTDPCALHNVDVDLALGRVFSSFDSMVQRIKSRVLPVVEQGATQAQVSATSLIDGIPDSDLGEETKFGMPTLGQPTISLSVNDAGPKLVARLDSAVSKDVLLRAEPPRDDEIVNWAEEITRGYRVDVWDSVTKVWHPLCQRLGTYRLGARNVTWSADAAGLLDEGWVQLGVTSSPDGNPEAPTEMRLHENLFTWNGWSLVVERPGAALAEDTSAGSTQLSHPNVMKRTYVDPNGVTRELGDFDNPSVDMRAKFQVPPGTLPRLRLGTTYRFRARAVDLAGNGEPFVAGDVTDTPGGANDDMTTVSRAITHKRYEPIKPPTVIPTAAPTVGESPFMLVLHSNYGTKPSETTARHICPPRTSFTMSEAHGAFDLTTTGRPMDGSAATYGAIAQKDAWDFPHEVVQPKDPSMAPRNGPALPMASIPTPLPYLADVPSRGASLSGLPGQKVAGAGVTYVSSRTPLLASTLVTTQDSSTERSASLRVPFEVDLPGGPQKRPFKLVVKGIEGTDARLTNKASPAEPVWNAAARTLTVQLPKAEQVTVELSSYCSSSDMRLFGTYQWGVTKSIADNTPAQTVSAIGPQALASAVMTPSVSALPVLAQTNLAHVTNTLIDVSVLGNNWTITPHDDLRLVHAVQQPMIAPNSTRYLQAVRQPGGTYAMLRDWVQIHGKSTARLVMNAYWIEPIDDGPGTGAPKWGGTAVQRKGQAFDLPIHPDETIALSLGTTPPADLPMPVTPVTHRMGGNIQRHAFGDTKHRKVKYTMVASSRFHKYFDASADTTRVGNSRWIHVPSTARPAPPKVDLVIPAFKWTRTGTTSASSTRGGGRLRVYLERPWFTSGADERLAVLVWNSGNSLAQFDKIRDYVTEWGNDPVYRSAGSVPVSIPTPESFTGWKNKKTMLVPAEYSAGGLYVTALGYEVQFDPDSDRWFADITVNQGNAYLPFIKLALARYQPYSLDGLELSRSVAVDAVQLTPDRTASVSWGTSSLTVNVRGRSYAEADSGYGPLVTMSFETRAANGLAWVPKSVNGQTELPLTTYTPAMMVYGNTSTYWHATVARTALGTLTGENRIVIREYERHLTGSPVAGESLGSRPVYVDVLPLSPPAV